MSKREFHALPPVDPAQRYTIPEVGRYLRESRAATYKKIKAGRLPTIKDGRRTYVPGSAIIAASRAA